MILFFWLAAAVVVGATLPLSAAAAEADPSVTPGYQLPPRDVVDILNARPTPVASLSPDRSALLLVDYEPYPPLALLARPFLKLGGLRVDPALNGPQRTTEYTGLTLLRVATGDKVSVKLPAGARIDVPTWSYDSKRFAFTRDLPDGVEVWVGDAQTGACKAIPNLRLSEVIGGGMAWTDNSRHLLVQMVPAGRGPAPDAPRVPAGPVTLETAGKVSKVATFQDLLASDSDEAQFAFYAQSQLARVDAETGAITPLGAPALFLSARLSPDEKFLLVTRLKKPFSRRVPYYYFARTVEVWNAQTGECVATIADLPVSDEVPPQGVPTGPRSVTWQEKKPATLLWVEALDEGDPLKKVPHRDQVMRLDVSEGAGSPRLLLRVTHRFAGWDWLQTPDQVMLSEYDRDRRWRTTFLLDLSRPDETKKTVFDLSVNDAYNDPGAPVYQTQPDGDRTILQDGEHIYLSGRGASPDGDRPFLDRMSLSTLMKERLFRGDENSYEAFVAFADNTREHLLTSYQTPTKPGNYFVVNRVSGGRRALTDFADPHPQITGMKKELVKYARAADNVPLSGTLYLPPGYDPASGKRLPLILWAYPEEYSDAGTAGQVRGSTKTFTRLSGTSPLWFVTQGYAVLNDATMPVVGDPETMNDTFVEQIVGAAKAAIDKLDAMGIVDPKRVVVAGHSYGAFMTANLLAHAPGMFAAGIARSGAYNRTLTPFGFQSERRSFWEAPEVYARLSPFTHANKIKDPILLIHGQADNNPGTFTIQSERFFQALQASGATSRLVLLPHESHGYRARESVLHVLAEMFAWADKYAKNKEQQP